MQERMSAKQFREMKSGGKCPTCGRGGKSKFGAVAVTDPETGTRIPSKHEMRVLARKRMEADALKHITALHPRFKIEGGFWSGDIIEIAPTYEADVDGWFRACCRVFDAKGTLTPASRRSIKAVKERWGIEVQIVKE